MRIMIRRFLMIYMILTVMLSIGAVSPLKAKAGTSAAADMLTSYSAGRLSETYLDQLK